MDHRAPTPEESLDSLKRKVADAKLRLDFASQYVEEIDSDFRSGLTPSPNSSDRERATRAQNSAHEEYLRVLKIYEDFVARGKAAHNGAGVRSQTGSQPDSTADREEP